MRDGLLSFQDVVDELLVSFRSKDDWPAKHRCTKPLGYDASYDPPGVCTHQQWSTQALLARIEGLVEPGSSMVAAADRDRRPSKRAGSPAPWAAGPAELLDEILLGALGMDRMMRRTLDVAELPVKRKVLTRKLHPDWRPPLALMWVPDTVTVTQPASKVPKHEAGHAALADLPRLLPRFQDEHPDDPAANGPYIRASEPQRGRRWGSIEATVRGWHKRARVMTGHVVDDRTVVHRLPNPHSGTHLLGPVCEQVWSCGHDSCQLIWLSWAKPTIPLRCPHCWTLGLVQDEETGAMFCDRPSCRDDDGARYEWSLDALFQLLRIEGGELG